MCTDAVPLEIPGGNKDSTEMNWEDHPDIECGAITQYLRKRQLERLWTGASLKGGVIMKRQKDAFLCQPSSLFNEMPGLLQGITHINAKVGYDQSIHSCDENC